MKLAIVTCHKYPDYVRALTLRTAAQQIPGVETIVIKNKHRGLLRYPEMIIRLIWLRIRSRPDAYMVTFRGYEILPFAAALTWPRPLVYDELINPLEWLHEQAESWAKFVPLRLLDWVYHLLLKRCVVVIADTDAHAVSSATLSRIDRERFVTIPVSAEETIFHPFTDTAESIELTGAEKPFQIFFYSNMRPLHGLEHILSAAISLKELPINFVIVGGKETTLVAVQAAQAQGAHITYHAWIDFAKLPEEIHKAGLCLGGPFGDTAQARQVVTGKTFQFLACAAPTVVGQNEASNLFIDKQNCLLVPLGNPAALAAAIEWAYRHPSELKTIGQQGRKLYEQEYSSDTVTKRLGTALQRIRS